MDSYHSYPKIYQLGHAYLSELLFDEVLVEEKLDGSQFSFGKFAISPLDFAIRADIPPQFIRCRSKGAEIHVDAPEKMFVEAVRSVQNVFPLLREGWTYRAEYLAKPKHNVLAYNRVPNGHLIIFDINTGNETYLSYEEKKAEAERLGFEVVPKLYQGKIESAEFFRDLLDRESILGGQKIEGVVVKNYSRFGRDKKALMGKFVAEAFKEIHNADWKDRNPGQADILTRLVEKYKTPARWNKAIQHLREAGQLEDSPKDIGKLIQETEGDILKECEDEIKSDLWHWAWSHVRRGCTHGLPEWYKEILLKKQFENPPPDVRSENLSGLAA